LFKAIKLVQGESLGLHGNGAGADGEWRAIERIKAIRHPFLLSIDRVERIDGELLIVTELADKNLFDLFEEYQRSGLPGIPRGELLRYLHEAAEVLDLLNFQHELQHLDVKPHNLFVVSGHVKVADFGLVNSLQAGCIDLAAITPLYASPELFHGRLSPHSDQYSLAIVYHEMLTGCLPFQGNNVRQLLLQHTAAPPDLGALPEGDQPLVHQALAKEPGQRFPSCLDFIRALQAVPDATGAKVAAHAPLPGNGTAPARTAPKHEARPVPADTEPVLARTPGPIASRAVPARQPAPPFSGLSGYTFQQCLAVTPLMDVWRVRGPGGKTQLAKLVYGAAVQDLEAALVRYKQLHHPALLTSELVQRDPGRLVLVSDEVDDCLRDHFQQCVAQGLPGVPRVELLGWLRAAAEALDYLYQQHSIQHLGLNPRTLLLQQGRLILSDFGLAQLLWLPAGQQVGQRNARHAAPELFDGILGRGSDQLSLAMIYQEMLTGLHPYRGQSPRSGGRPALEPLAPQERDIIARALHPDPQQRWDSCMELVQALEASQSGGPAPAPVEPDAFSERVSASGSGARARPAMPGAAGESPLGDLIARLLASATGELPVAAEQDEIRLVPEEGVLRHRFHTGLPLGSARLKLDAFRQQGFAQLIRDDDRCYVFHVSMPAQFWRQWIGRQPGLEIEVQLARLHALAPTPIEVSVQIRTFRCTQRRAIHLLGEMGMSLLEGLRTALVIGSEKRIQDRISWPHPLQVRPIFPSGEVGEAVSCRGKDMSLSGIGFYLPHELPTADVRIDLPATAATPTLAIPATLVRARRGADGWYEVGALFCLAALRKSLPYAVTPVSALAE
jgi:serine/threonine protein kinase